MDEFLISEFQKLGVDEKSAVMAMQVYLEVCEVKRYWNPEYEYNASLGKIVIKAKKKPKEPVSVFVPVASYENLSFTMLSEILESTQAKSLFLVIVHPDSTCVYYQISQDLLEPTETSAKHLRVNKQEKLDADLRKHRKTIEQAALFGIPITIAKEKDKEAACSEAPLEAPMQNVENKDD